VPEWARAARARWRYTGVERPAFARDPAEGQRSVWDFPRPPAIEPVVVEVSVRHESQQIAQTRSCLRVLETGSPPTYYIPGPDIEPGLLRPATDRSLCEWKGDAHYWDLALGRGERLQVAWSYPEPFPEFERLRDHFSFYPSRVECRVGSIRAESQPGGYYGGWVTPELTGPFKGEPGTESL